ncbi:MAG: multiheme c-type cytochrome [Planctomycetaceae bacterium]
MAFPVARFAGGVLAACVLAAADGCESRRSAAPPAPPRAALPAPLMTGAGSCTSAGCHAASIADHAPWQSAYTVWATRDPHARAHDVLQGPVAERIVAALAARDPSRRQPPARENMACVGCHATGRGPLAGEGVSCESCHGPAGPWLVAHAAQDWTTKGNHLGMIDLADPFTCATTCAECHVGGPPTADGAIREVTHDLIAAGHPRLAFELRSSKRAEPPHWRDRFATPADPHAVGPVEEWAAGRLATLECFLRQVDSQAESVASGVRGLTAGVWPEFTAFDCHGCHRPARLATATDAVVMRRAARPGSPRLEPMLWTHLDLVLPAAASGPLLEARAAVEHGWSRVPDRRLLATAIDAAVKARGAVPDHVATIPSGDLAGRIAAATDAAHWAEAGSAYGCLEAIAAREVAAGRIAADAGVFARLAMLRQLLEFPLESTAGVVERFASPRGYAAEDVATTIREIATALAPRPLPTP